MDKTELNKMLTAIHQQAEKQRLARLHLTRLTALAFLVTTAVFLFFVPEFIKSLALLGLAVIICWYGMQTQPTPDNEDADGGWDAMFGNNLLVILITLVIFATGVALFLSTLISAIAENYMAIGSFGFASTVIFLVDRKLSKKIKAHSEAVEDVADDCWVCSCEAYTNGTFQCPICGFVSKAKNPYRGLCAHMDNMHKVAWRQTPLFRRLCKTCQSVPEIGRYLKSSGPSKFGH